MTQPLFRMCGHVCPEHVEKRCELAGGHTSDHLAGDVRWNLQGHKHLSDLDALLFKSSLRIDRVLRNFAAMDEAEGAMFDQPKHPVGSSGHDPLWGAGPSDLDQAGFDAELEQTRAEEELADWWREAAEEEIGQTVAKAVEYGSTDLVDIGRSLARVAGRELDDQQAAEWGIFFYLEGKLSRWRSAMERGDVPSFDTLLDIGVYARMAQRVRQTGSWPGTETDK